MNPANEPLAEVVAIALEAGKLLMDGFRRPVVVERKGVVDLVTEMDRRSEELIIRRLTASFPGTKILAEESGGARESDDAGLWIVDPLDGTTNYAHGFAVFAVSIAFERNGVVELGVVLDPTRGDCFTAARGKGAHLGDRPITVSRRDRVDEALLATGFPYDIRTSERDNIAPFSLFARRSRAVRRAGAAALDLAGVAAGWFDGFWEEKLAPWDVAAGVLLVEEAGGRLSDYDGGPAVIRTGRVVASNGRIHDEMIALLRESGATPPG